MDSGTLCFHVVPQQCLPSPTVSFLVLGLFVNRAHVDVKVEIPEKVLPEVLRYPMQAAENCLLSSCPHSTFLLG